MRSLELVTGLGSLLSEEISPSNWKSMMTKNLSRNAFITLEVCLHSYHRMPTICVHTMGCTQWCILVCTANSHLYLFSAFLDLIAIQSAPQWSLTHPIRQTGRQTLMLQGTRKLSPAAAIWQLWHNEKTMNLKLWKSLIQQQHGSEEAGREMPFTLSCLSQPERMPVKVFEPMQGTKQPVELALDRCGRRSSGAGWGLITHGWSQWGFCVVQSWQLVRKISPSGWGFTSAIALTTGTAVRAGGLWLWLQRNRWRKIMSQRKIKQPGYFSAGFVFCFVFLSNSWKIREIFFPTKTSQKG